MFRGEVAKLVVVAADRAGASPLGGAGTVEHVGAYIALHAPHLTKLVVTHRTLSSRIGWGGVLPVGTQRRLQNIPEYIDCLISHVSAFTIHARVPLPCQQVAAVGAQHPEGGGAAAHDHAIMVVDTSGKENLEDVSAILH